MLRPILWATLVAGTLDILSAFVFSGAILSVLQTVASGPFGNEAPGDLAYYAPWGNLAFFYESYRYSGGLIRLGRIDGDIAADPARLAEVETRRDLIHRLQQKYGATVEGVLEARRVAAEELDLLDTADLDLRTLGVQRAALEAGVRAAASALTAKRTSAADRLA